MSEEPQPPLNPTKPTYHVPSAPLADPDRSPSVGGWIGMHCLVFGLSCLIFPILVVGCVLILAAFDQSSSPTQAPLSDGFKLIFVVGIPAFITIYAASLLLWAVVGDDVQRASWVNNSAIVGTIGLLAWLSTKQPIKFSALDDYTLFVFQSFALTSSIIGWVQWLELRKTIDHAWQWPLITIGMWTGLGTMTIGFGIHGLIFR
ncbi:hypothetical protein [Herpetosiphon geysericola]|uniref:Uncharacterized protein n=1 Tax=Herpetosiphon geysericola TaxID=70996 RepID=A0A0P6YXR1_9CHLR|nr:hypothetical protein [Herpetosiphon geysericola]KPL88899.1 hypothetical protein SE18_09540 [Herpetosiphon geysericola]